MNTKLLMSAVPAALMLALSAPPASAAKLSKATIRHCGCNAGDTGLVVFEQRVNKNSCKQKGHTNHDGGTDDTCGVTTYTRHASAGDCVVGSDVCGDLPKCDAGGNVGDYALGSDCTVAP